MAVSDEEYQALKTQLENMQATVTNIINSTSAIIKNHPAFEEKKQEETKAHTPIDNMLEPAGNKIYDAVKKYSGLMK